MITQAVTRLSIDEAAAALGVSRPTIRRRLRDGVLKGSQVTTPHGLKWYIELEGITPESPRPPTESQVTPQADQGGAQAREIARLEAHNRDLQQRVEEQSRYLEDRAREVRELHTLLAQTQRLLTDSSMGSQDGQVTTQTQNAAPEWPERRRWWQRLVWS
jgi:excisionase family DNA binding protein